MEARMNSAEAAISCSPFLVFKKLPERIQMRIGTLKMRLSVM
jgi:hypothetical protein